MSLLLFYNFMVLVMNQILDLTIFVMSRNVGHMYCLRHLYMFITFSLFCILMGLIAYWIFKESSSSSSSLKCESLF